MNYTIIETPPHNLSDYVSVPPNDIAEQYSGSLAMLMKAKTFHILAAGVPMDWVMQAAVEAEAGSYRIMMQRIPVNYLPVLSTAFGNFYFDRILTR